MTTLSNAKHPPASLDDVQRLIGDVDPETILDIVKTEATLGEIEQALSCANEGECKWPLGGRVATVYDILMADPAFTRTEEE